MYKINNNNNSDHELGMLVQFVCDVRPKRKGEKKVTLQSVSMWS